MFERSWEEGKEGEKARRKDTVGEATKEGRKNRKPQGRTLRKKLKRWEERMEGHKEGH